MNRMSLICGAIVLSALPGFATSVKAASQEEILRRLDKLEQENSQLEQENSSLKSRLNRVDSRGGAAARSAPPAAGPRYADPSPPPPPAPGPQPNIALKAPVEYIKACSMYGAGFYTVPGTDACIKIGGYIRLQGTFNGSGEGTVNGADNMAPQGRNDRFDSSNINYDARAVMSADVRVPTSVGLLRGYMRLGAEMDTPIGSSWMTTLAQPVQSNAPFVFWDRGYVQFAGFTVGKTRSFFDIFAASDGYLTYGNLRTTGDTDLTGVIMAAFTYNWGNGFSSSLSVEDPNGHYKVGAANLASPAFGLGTLTVDNAFQSGVLNQGMGVPDIIANLRVDQSWGYAGISGALHQVAGGYFSNPTAGTDPCGAFVVCSALGHPPVKFGGAVAVGGDVYVPTGPGDTFGVNAVFSDGAVNFATKGSRWQLYSGGSAGFAWGVDGVFDNVGSDGSIQLTQAWSINSGYEHHWNDQWKTSVYGGYAAVNYNGTATGIINQHLSATPARVAGTAVCGVPVEGVVQPPLLMTGAGNTCSPDYNFWQVGTRTQYSPTPWLDLGIDTTYTRLNTAYRGSNVTLAGNGAQPGGATFSIDNQNVWTVMARAQFKFLTGN